MKEAETDSKETMSKLVEAMGNDPAMPEEDRDLGTLLLNALDSLSLARFVLQKKDLGKSMIEKQQDYMEANSLIEDLLISVVTKQVTQQDVKRFCEDSNRTLDVTHNTEDLEVSSVLRRWRVSLMNRKQEILKEVKKKKEQEKSLSENMKIRPSRYY